MNALDTKKLEPDPMPAEQSLHSLIQVCWNDLVAIAEREQANYPGASDDTASLLGEALKRVLGQRGSVANADQLRGLTTVFLRRTAIDRLRRRSAEKRATSAKSDLARAGEDRAASSSQERAEILADALEQLVAYDQRKATILTLTYACAMDSEGVAQALGLSKSTVNRELSLAYAWIALRIREGIG